MTTDMDDAAAREQALLDQFSAAWTTSASHLHKFVDIFMAAGFTREEAVDFALQEYHYQTSCTLQDRMMALQQRGQSR